MCVCVCVSVCVCVCVYLNLGHIVKNQRQNIIVTVEKGTK